jgi:hypothetical protein
MNCLTLHRKVGEVNNDYQKLLLWTTGIDTALSRITQRVIKKEAKELDIDEIEQMDEEINEIDGIDGIGGLPGLKLP